MTKKYAPFYEFEAFAQETIKLIRKKLKTDNLNKVSVNAGISVECLRGIMQGKTKHLTIERINKLIKYQRSRYDY